MSNDNAQRLEKLSPAQRQLLLKALREQAARAGEAHVIPRRKQQQNEAVALSFSQERQWLLNQLTPDSPAYNVSVPLRIEGIGETALLEKVLNEIIRRHEILRTSFPVVDGEPFQVVAPAYELRLPVTDLRDVPPERMEAETRRLIAEESQRLFDLAAGPVFRAKLFRQEETVYILVITMPHIITDGWSMGQFFQEMAAISKAFLAGEESPLPELPIQYADYAAWQREWLRGEVLEEHLSYWKKQFEGVPTLLKLPTDRPRPAMQNYRGETYTLHFSRELHEGLKDLSQREGVTMFMLLVAALQTLLYRYSGQDDIVVGSYLANRNRAETEKLIGYFVSTLALRTDLSGNPTFRELLAQVREVALGAYAHQELPFEKLLEEIQPERSLSHAPLFQVGLNFGNISTPDDVELPGLTISRVKRNKGVVLGSSQLDLTLDIHGLERGMYASMLYDTTLFDEATIARMMEHFRVLLEGIVAHPEQRLAELPLLTASERHRLLNEWNGTQADAAPEVCVHQLFEAQAARTPDATALIFGNEGLTYRELNERANQLAHHLRKSGVKPEVRVGVCMTRSINLLVSILGILKAGGAYVPLDPTYPQERLELMMRSSQSPLLLTVRKDWRGQEEQNFKVICLDTAWAEIAQESTENPQSGVLPENPAYVIYTSGSTSQPKGVVIEHRSLVSYTETARDKFALTSSDRVLQFASISFDTSAEEIYPCLTSGGTLVLRTDAMLNSIPAFLRSCAENRITVLDLPTAYWHELTNVLGEDGLALPASIRLVIIGGERALPERLQTWQALVSQNVRLVNTYGPTETTIVATICELSEITETAQLLREVSIGGAIRNVQTYVLDRSLRPVPIGVPGELYIGGSGLARGYLESPELTAERFIPNPFSQTPGARLYATGDQVSYCADGNLDFHGRIDSQVKVRGFRIDLGEIETVLAQYPGLRQAAVIARQDAPGDTRLVAYAVAGERKALTADELRSFLSKKLPGHMIPSGFVMLDELPLTPNGKIDRRKLLASTETSVREVPFVAPGSPIEEMLADIWSSVLKVQEVGVNDSFFSLGGHSLLATQVVYQLHKALNINLPLRSIFEEPTIAGLALVIEEILLEEIERLSDEEADLLAFDVE